MSKLTKMQEFAEVLKSYEHKIVSYRKLSDAVNVDRTTLKRYVCGERLPKNIETVRAIAREIGMSETEEQHLIEAYKRSQMGEKKYEGYQLINKIFNGDIKKNNYVLNYDNPNIEFANDTHKDFVKIEGIQDVRNILYYVCKDATKIYVMTQLGEIYSYITEFMKHNENGCVEVLFKLDTLDSEDNLDDLESFSDIYELLSSGHTCDIYVSYDYGCNEKLVNHNYILSDQGVLVFSTLDGEEHIGFYTEKEDVKLYFENKLKEIHEKSYIYARSTNHPPQTINNAKKVLENPHSHITFELCDTVNPTEIRIKSNHSIQIYEHSIVELFCNYIDANTKD